MKKNLLLFFAALLALSFTAQAAQAGSTTAGINVSRGQGDSMAYNLSISQMYEPWISTGVCQLNPLAEIGGHAWVPDDNDEDTVWGGFLSAGLRFTLFTDKVIRPYLEGSLGGAASSEDHMDNRDLGSHVLLRTRGSVGVNFGDGYSHKIQGDIIHHSTGGLTNTNDGYTTYGLAYGYSF